MALLHFVDKNGPACDSLQARQRHVLTDRLVQKTSLLLSILGHQRQAGADGLFRRSQRTHFQSVDVQRATIAAIGTENDPGQFGAPAPTSPANPTISPAFASTDRSLSAIACRPLDSRAREIPLTASTVSPGLAVRARLENSTSRPTMRRTKSRISTPCTSPRAT